MNGRTRVVAVVGALAATMLVGSGATAGTKGGSHHGDRSGLRVKLSGYQEDPLTRSTTGTGTFRVRINKAQNEITYTLSYSGLQAVTQAHIHFGLRSQSGGISVFLCSNLGNGPAGTQACPASPATITGTIRPADVIGPADQGIAAGEFAELIAAIRAGATYVNVHTATYPGGEIRAQLVR